MNQVIPKSPPKINPLLKTLYLFGVIGMFSFFYLLVRQYAVDSKFNQQTTIATAATANTTASSPVSSMPALKSMPEFYISGKAFTLHLNDDVQPQIDKAWLIFANKDITGMLSSKYEGKEIYAAYHDYLPENNELTLVLGYATAKQEPLPSGYLSILLPAGNYFETNNILTTWYQVDKLNLDLSYRGDYEIYQVDSSYQVLSQTAYLLAN